MANRIAILDEAIKNCDIEDSSFSDIVKKAKEMLLNQLKSKDSKESLVKFSNEVGELAQKLAVLENVTKSDVDRVFSKIENEAKFGKNYLSAQEYRTLLKNIEMAKMQLKELGKYN